MGGFVNHELNAPNVFKAAVDQDVMRTVAEAARGRSSVRRFYSKAPPWPSDIRWISPRTAREFAIFRRIFDELGVAKLVEPFVDVAQQVRLYNAQFIVRSSCTAANFHVDWRETGNQAFTLMTPLTGNSADFGMLYKKLDGSVGEYDYRMGEALIFGDDFVHSTKPGSSADPVILFCLTFGTDKMEYWPNIERTVARQCLLTCRPDGRFQRLPIRQRVRNMVGPHLRRAGLSRSPDQSADY